MQPYSLMRIAGIRIVIDPTWVLVFLLVVGSLGSDYLPAAAPHLKAATSWTLAVVAAVLLFGSVLVHERSPASLARPAAIPVPRIRRFRFGGGPERAAEPHGPRAERRIAAVGPLPSLAIAAAGFAVSVALEGRGSYG